MNTRPPATTRDAAGSLLSWRYDGAVTEALSDRLMAHPGFDAAARGLVGGMLAAAAADPCLDGVFKDGGRYVVAMIAFLLHDDGGLTLPRLKDFCERSGFVSRSRARGMLIYLRFLRYVEPAPREAGAPQRYMPTASFQAAWVTQAAVALGAVARIEPAAMRVAQALDRPEVLAHFARVHVEHLFESAKAEAAPFQELLHRHAGSYLLWVLLADEAESFPPKAPKAISAAGFARRFGVSRPQVRRLLEAGVASGLFTRDADGGVAFAPDQARPLRRFYAQQFAALLSSAAATLEAWGV